MWVLLVAPDEDLGRYQARFARPARRARRPPGRPGLVAGEAFLRLGATYPIADPDLGLVRDCQNLAGDGRDAVVIVTRKVDPVAALFHGLGPARAKRLPGFLGNFLLTSAECRAAEPAVGEAFGLDDQEQAAVPDRIDQWLETGDTDKPAEQILRAVPAVWGRATRLGLGVCATTEAI